MIARTPPRISESAQVHPNAAIGDDVRVWGQSQVREGAVIGDGTTIGRNVYIDHDVRLGRRCKVQNNALLYWPAEISDGVFIGPGVILTNDRYPRAITPDEEVMSVDDWSPAGVTVGVGASVGAGAVILAGVHVGAWSLIAAGAVVIRDVPDHALVVGNPADVVGWVGKSGRRLNPDGDLLVDPANGTLYRHIGDALELAD